MYSIIPVDGNEFYSIGRRWKCLAAKQTFVLIKERAIISQHQGEQQSVIVSRYVLGF